MQVREAIGTVYRHQRGGDFLTCAVSDFLQKLKRIMLLRFEGRNTPIYFVCESKHCAQCLGILMQEIFA